MFLKGKAMFLYSKDQLETLRLLEFFVNGLIMVDFARIFGKVDGEVCFRANDVFVTFDPEVGRITTDRISVSQAETLPTAFVLPGGLVTVNRPRGWQLYDPRAHTLYPEIYIEPPAVFQELKLPVVLLTRNGQTVLMNVLTKRLYRVKGRKVEVVSPYHLIVEAQARRFLYDLRSMTAVFVEQYAVITPRFSVVDGEDKKALLDREMGDLYWVDNITVSEGKLSRYLLDLRGDIIGYVEGTSINWAHPSRLGVHH